MLLLVAALTLVLTIPLGLDRYMPVPENNPITTEKIELGRRLFFDRRLSRDRSISCATCHQPERAFSDQRARAIGVLGRGGRRNAPALINKGYGRSFFWDGRTATLEEQVLKPIQDPNEMDLTLAEAASRVNLSAATMSHALATYLRSILAGDSAYDRFIAGDRHALSVEAQRGLLLFRGRANCTACHIGPTLTDERFHNTGVAWRSVSAASARAGHFDDPGRFAVSGVEADRGAFKTPTLREVARTAPYMHDGSVATLQDVVDFYNAGGRTNPHLDSEIRPLGLTVLEKAELVTFLMSLSGSIQTRQP